MELYYGWKFWLLENLSVISHKFSFIVDQVMNSAGDAES